MGLVIIIAEDGSDPRDPKLSQSSRGWVTTAVEMSDDVQELVCVGGTGGTARVDGLNPELPLLDYGHQSASSHHQKHGEQLASHIVVDAY